VRKIIGFAVLAIVAWLVLKLVFGVLGTIIGLAFWILGLAIVGYVVYLVLRLLAPRTAGKLKEMISGKPEYDRV